MIKKILCILPVITLLYMAPGTLFAAEGETSGAVQTAVEQIAAEQTAEQQTETEPAAAMAYGPAAEAAAGTEAAAQDGNGSEAQTVERGSGGTAGGLYGGRSLRDGSCAGRRMPELPGSGTALCGLCCFKQKKSSFISKHGQGSCLPERTVFLYKGRKLLQGADGAQLGKCQDASRKRQRASGQCHMAVGRQTGKRRLCENKVALLLLLISCSFY